MVSEKKYIIIKNDLKTLTRKHNRVSRNFSEFRLQFINNSLKQNLILYRYMALFMKHYI